MNFKNCLLCFIALLSFFSCEEAAVDKNISAEVNPEGFTPEEFYQLKIFTFDTEDQLSITEQYLKEAYLPAIKRQGFTNIGVFKPRATDADTTKRIYVLTPFSSLAQFALTADKLEKDEAYQTAGSPFLEAPHDQAPFRRIVSVLLRAFEEMPVMRPVAMDSPRADRIYELRSYESATEKLYRKKVDMFNAGGEVELFEQLGFNAVFYAEVLSGDKMPNLMYMTSFTDQASRDEHWDAFVNAPKWKEISTMPKYLNTVSHADILFLYPTDYSDY